MRTEAEIREAIALCESCNPPTQEGIQNRDVTVEALRYALGIDDQSSSPMEMPLASLLQDCRDNPEKHGIKPTESFSA
jgi:hypothetical protein